MPRFYGCTSMEMLKKIDSHCKDISQRETAIVMKSFTALLEEIFPKINALYHFFRECGSFCAHYQTPVTIEISPRFKTMQFYEKKNFKKCQ